VPEDVYVYRDATGQPDDPGAAVAAGSAEQDAAYWYDLPGAHPGEDTPHVLEETRGPFEPLLSSADPTGTTPRFSSTLDAEPAAQAAGPDEALRAGGDGPENSAQARAQKLEQIKDLYLTAEAIGQANVDKHFDQLLAQQRELISEYFKQSSVAKAAGGLAGQAETEPGDPPDPDPSGGPASAPEGAGVAADPPRVW
jgi:hypothetical protein